MTEWEGMLRATVTDGPTMRLPRSRDRVPLHIIFKVLINMK